jgi:hypothetical protein
MQLLDDAAPSAAPSSDAPPTNGDLVGQRRRHALLRRRAFFERRDDGWQHMLPYRQLGVFQEATRRLDKQADEVKRTLLLGISRAEGAADSPLAANNVCLRAARTEKAKVHSFRLFPAGDFALRLPVNPSEAYLEYAPDQLLFRHAPADPNQQPRGVRPAELVVSLDVLELLALIADGHRPSPDDAEGVFVNLTIFKNALAHLPYRAALLTRDNRQFYEVSLVAPGRVRLRGLPFLGAQHENN